MARAATRQLPEWLLDSPTDGSLQALIPAGTSFAGKESFVVQLPAYYWALR